MLGLYTENYKTWLREMKELHKCPWVRRFNTVKMPVLLEILSRFIRMPVRTLAVFSFFFKIQI